MFASMAGAGFQPRGSVLFSKEPHELADDVCWASEPTRLAHTTSHNVFS